MGILLNLLTLPVSAPINGVTWLAAKLLEQAEGELYNEDKLRAALLQLEERFEMGEIDEAAYEALEDSLLKRLKEIRRWKAAKNGG